MDSREQVILAGKLGAALLAAGWEVAHIKQRSGHVYYETAEMVNVIGALYRAGYVLRETDASAPPARPPRLIVFPRERRS